MKCTSLKSVFGYNPDCKASQKQWSNVLVQAPELGQVSEVFRVRCPSCDKALKVPAAARGRKVECSGCGTNFKISSKLNPTAKKKAPKPQAARPAARQSPRRPNAPAAGRPKKPKPRSPDFVNDSFLDIDDDIEFIDDDIEVLDDVDVIDDVEVLDEPRRKPSRKPARKSSKASAKPNRRSRSDVVEDFEVVEDYDDDFLDLPDGYEDGPSVPKPPKKKKRKRTSAPPPRDDCDDEAGIGSVIGGLLCMIAGAAIVYFGVTTDTRRPARAIGFGVVLFFSGAGAVIRGLN